MRLIIFALFVVLTLAGCDKGTGKITVHDAYSELLETDVFPIPVKGKLREILDDTNHFGLTEYQELDLAINAYCTGAKVTWRDHLHLLPMKAVSIIVPSWNSFSVLMAPELLIIRQVDAAQTCEFNPLIKYMES
ncbi:hypothetical protein J4N45_09830 [Vibrio sp. SCSIO 43140]|uniref:hypothetical protein n=1 Tax=Vibrio sp. SCSIO 43140 TaxID=2819100 RepID=UPI0020760BB5|nr:hypothetical protein [Vibrio sp. SCSIO 43140]USD58827.1 hypothetical protein J4N45_09830 [Vibrio sp. SCSIO 43140]